VKSLQPEDVFSRDLARPDFDYELLRGRRLEQFDLMLTSWKLEDGRG
jgi:hypothetical protein